MQHKYKDHSYSNALTHSAVYRAASPSPNKSFKRPSSKYSLTDQISSLNLAGSFCSAQTTKKGYLRNTVEVDKSCSSSNDFVVEVNKKLDKIEVLQALGKTERSPF